MYNKIFILYYSVWGWSDSIDTKQMWIDSVANNLTDIKKKLNSEQFNNTMSGAEEYLIDASDFFLMEFKITTETLPGSIELNNAIEIENKLIEILESPLQEYRKKTHINYEEHISSALSEEQIRITNKSFALEQIQLLGFIFALVIFLIIVLLIFKVENSIRHQADSLESLNVIQNKKLKASDKSVRKEFKQ